MFAKRAGVDRREKSEDTSLITIHFAWVNWTRRILLQRQIHGLQY